MKQEVDEIYHWQGLGDGCGTLPSCCRLRILYPHPEQAVVILGDIDQGASITNSAEFILPQIAAAFGLDLYGTVWIEHYPQYRDDPDGVEFSQIHLSRCGNKVGITWSYLTQEQAEALAGEEL